MQWISLFWKRAFPFFSPCALQSKNIPKPQFKCHRSVSELLVFFYTKTFSFFLWISIGASNIPLYPSGRNENSNWYSILDVKEISVCFSELLNCYLSNLFFLSPAWNIANKWDNYNGSCLTGEIKIFAQIIEFSYVQRAQNWIKSLVVFLFRINQITITFWGHKKCTRATTHRQNHAESPVFHLLLLPC